MEQLKFGEDQPDSKAWWWWCFCVCGGGKGVCASGVGNLDFINGPVCFLEHSKKKFKRQCSKIGF